MKLKTRLDQLLIEKGFFASKNKAQAAILAGLVFVNDKKIIKSGTKFSEEIKIAVKGKPHPYVSRGGVKLNQALQEFSINVKDKVCLDIGASTGGFTDCLLQNGAKLVYAIDVGYGQFDWKLRNDARVILLERTNARYLTAEKLYKKKVELKVEVEEERATLAVIDVSFISLEKIIPPVKNLLAENGEIVALIKPQFEAGKDKVEKGGMVSDPQVHREVIKKISKFAENINLKKIATAKSPLIGDAKNLEYFIYLKK